MTPARFTAFWLVGQFVLLVILYHAAPWPWASRSLSMLGALIPAWALLTRADPRESEFLYALSGALLATSFWFVVTFLTNLTTPIAAAPAKVVDAYRIYVPTYITAQCLLTICWYAWWRAGAPWPALGGAFLAALGTVTSAYVHAQRSAEDVLAMHPWRYMWEPGAGPVDVISRVAPQLASVEVLVLGGASIALAVAAWRKG